nr:immunoglobulin light chain junction region [Macaca mulatta]
DYYCSSYAAGNTLLF